MRERLPIEVSERDQYKRAELFSIGRVGIWLRLDGFWEYNDRPYKAACPQNVFHPDGGIEAANRVYSDTNTAWCFACQKFWTPVSMTRAVKDLFHREAVEALTEQFLPPRSETTCQQIEPVLADLGLEDLARALTLYGDRRLASKGMSVANDPLGIGDLISRAMKLLPAVKTPADSVKWLNGSKRAIEVRLAQHQF